MCLEKDKGGGGISIVATPAHLCMCRTYFVVNHPSLFWLRRCLLPVVWRSVYWSGWGQGRLAETKRSVCFFPQSCQHTQSCSSDPWSISLFYLQQYLSLLRVHQHTPRTVCIINQGIHLYKTKHLIKNWFFWNSPLSYSNRSAQTQLQPAAHQKA